jgi:hypothetical protein
MMVFRIVFVLSVPAALLSASETTPTPGAEAIEFFEKKVRPLLVEHCHSCHGPEKQKAGLRLDSRAAVLKGSDGGIVVVPGQPEKSKLIEAIGYQGELKMPPKQRLRAEAVETLTAWIKMGAPWPDTKAVSADGKKTPSPQTGSEHWAFQPVRSPVLPPVKNVAWPRTPLDRFILTKLEAKDLKPAATADRRTLLRRASYDLIGLPPAAEEIEAFASDSSEAAFEKVVDRLLASPHFGERWGRHWLDVARYADERGYVGVGVDRVYPFAYTYRDWVIRAFNEDLPYDQFIIAQLAADQMIESGRHAPGGEHLAERGDHTDRRHLAAMGFLTVGRRFINNQHDIIDDRIDVVTRSFMGLTVTCARCHDHKYDPIPTADYYSLYGVFASSQEPDDLPLLDAQPSGPGYDAFAAELKNLEEEKAKFERENEQMKKERPREFKEKIKPFDNKIKQLHARHPGAPGRGMVMRDRERPTQPRVFLRGQPGNPGPEVPRQFLAILCGDKRQPFQHGSGRLELAQAIASPNNPLTARVMVNRVWLHLFGHGLVRTPSDFGTRSDPPTHPELLDHLARRFMADGWSMKKLIRSMVLSSTYQQSSQASAPGNDPENLLLARMNRGRLDFEALRDSMLFVSGQLDTTVHGRSVDLGKTPYSRRRTVYGFIDRQNLPGMFRTFDFAGPDTHSPMRFSTTVPQQALFLMNHPFVVEQVKKLVARPEIAAMEPGDGRVQALYRLVLGRSAKPEELILAREFLANPEPADKLNPWEQLAQVLVLSNEFVFVD